MKSEKKIILVSCFFLLPFFSFGWGVLGHRVVGQIAESYLTPKARVEIQKILGNESIAMASNWADFIKSDSAYQYVYNWHFIDVDSGVTKAQLRDHLQKDTVADLFTKTNFLIRELKNKQLSMDKKRMYLKLLIHFVGDIHQPFHVGRQEDLGGNKIKLTWFSTPTNLHAIWDEQLINFQQLSYTEYAMAINHITAQLRDSKSNQLQSVRVGEGLQRRGDVVIGEEGTEVRNLAQVRKEAGMDRVSERESVCDGAK